MTEWQVFQHVSWPSFKWAISELSFQNVEIYGVRNRMSPEIKTLLANVKCSCFFADDRITTGGGAVSWCRAVRPSTCSPTPSSIFSRSSRSPSSSRRCSTLATPPSWLSPSGFLPAPSASTPRTSSFDEFTEPSKSTDALPTEQRKTCRL